MNKFIFGSVVLVFGAVLGWYVFRGNNVQSALPSNPTNPGNVTVDNPSPAVNPNQPTSSASVKFTDTGFVPANITIKVGTTIRFTNESGAGMWVASNPHPTHTLLPGFDELKNVNRGGFYDYQFVKVGTWGYHNHLTPSVMGKVIVTP